MLNETLHGLALSILAFAFGGGGNDETPSGPPTPVAETSTFTDVEGNTYQTRKFGSSWWMIQNFKGTKTPAGTPIEGVFTYDDDPNHANTYGRLYTWPAALRATPIGWHLATQEDWDELIRGAGGANQAGGALKEMGSTHWKKPNVGATNSFGFTLLPGGFRGPDGLYYSMGEHGSFFGTASHGTEPFCVYTYNTTPHVIAEISPVDKTSKLAFSIRFVRNP